MNTHQQRTQELDHQKCDKMKAKVRKPATGNANSANAKPQAAKVWCKCQTMIGAKFPNGAHSPGKPQEFEPGPACGFFSIQCPRLQQYVAEHHLELDTARGRQGETEKDERKRIIEEQGKEHLRQQEAKKAQAELRRQEIEFCSQAARKAVCFLTFKYGRSVEERQNIGSRWTSNHLLPHVVTKQRTPSELGLASATTNELLDGARSVITRRQTGVTDSEQVFSTAPEFSSLTSVSQLRPVGPVNLADLSTFRRHPALALRDHDHNPPTPEGPVEMDNRHGIKIDDGGVGDQIREVIFDLAGLQSRIDAYRPDDAQGLHTQINQIAQSLTKLHEKVSDPSNPLHDVRIAQEIIDYVDDSRNPDIFTRDFVDLVLRGNAVMNGKQKAFRNFSKIYAKALKENFDGLDDEVDMVMGNAGMVEKDGKFVEEMQNGTAA